MSALARLLEQATPGPWERGYDGGVRTEDGRVLVAIPRAKPSVPNATLIALAPDMARLLIDMAEEMRKHSSENEHDYISHPKADALLARFAELQQRAAP